MPTVRAEGACFETTRRLEARKLASLFVIITLLNTAMKTSNLPIVVLISGNGSNLQAIIDAIASKKLPAEIRAVISDRENAYGLQRAQQAGIPAEILLAKNFESKISYDKALQNCIEKYQPKLIVMAGFMRILTPAFVKHFEGKILNIHPSLLPKHRGLHTHQRVIEAKDAEHGVTIHFVTEELDSGPMIAQAKLKVLPNDTAESLKEKIHQLEHQLYPEVIRWVSEKKLEWRKGKVFWEGKKLSATGIGIKD